MAIPDKAITRGEQYLAAMAGQSGTLPDEPITRKEFYLAKAAGQAVETPEPITREEMYLDAIAENSGGGGGEAVLVNKTISANGTYLPSADSADGYKKVVVNVPTPTLTTKTISANGTYAAADDSADGYSSVTVNAPTGAQLIASGTFVGNGSDAIDIPLGRKMPQTDFLFRAWVDDGTEFAYDTVYKAAGMFFPMHRPDYFDLSTDGTKTETAGGSINVNNNGAVTAVQERQSTEYFSYVRQAAYYHSIQSNDGYNRITRNSSGFTLNVNIRSAALQWVSGMTYSWELLYFGNSPETDIVEVA